MEGETAGEGELHQDYISNDPEENADNFDPEWASSRELNTDEERYLAIRKRWGNPDVPDPSRNLTCRQAEGLRGEKDASGANSHSGGKRRRRKRRRSCIGPYEKLTSNLQGITFERQNHHFQQEEQMINLLSNHCQQVRSFVGEKTKNIKSCKRCMEEVRAFFTFYKKINDSEVTLQMINEQYEHIFETERMYSMYSRFYR